MLSAVGPGASYGGGDERRMAWAWTFCGVVVFLAGGNACEREREREREREHERERESERRVSVSVEVAAALPTPSASRSRGDGVRSGSAA